MIKCIIGVMLVLFEKHCCQSSTGSQPEFERIANILIYIIFFLNTYPYILTSYLLKLAKLSKLVLYEK